MTYSCSRTLLVGFVVLLLVGVSFDPLEAQSCIVTTPIGTGDDEGYGIAVQDDGKIVIGGYFEGPADDDFAALRYSHDLRLDSSFDGDGIATMDIWGNDQAESIFIQSDDGRILLGGIANQGGLMGCCDEFTLARFDSDGTPDTGFDSDGNVTTNIDTSWDLGRTIAVQTDGKILLGGYLDDGAGNWNMGLVRYNADGSLDPTFNPSGTYGMAPNKQSMVVKSVGAGHDYGNSVVVQPDGKILLAGATWNATDWDWVIVRYETDGKLDTTFGTGGIVTDDLRGDDDWGSSIALQPDGKIVFGSKSSNGTDNDFAVARYNSDGSPDTAFGTNGMVFTPIGPGDDEGETLTLQTDGKIVLAGHTWNGADHDFAVVRYNADGSLDTSFGSGGKTVTPVGSADDRVHGVTIQPDGKILLVGDTDKGTHLDVAIARYNTDGTIDDSCARRYRSVGTSAANLNTSSRTVEIYGTTATFSGPMPDKIGVGDVLQYQITGTYHLAFIHGRVSDRVYTVAPADGGTPQATFAGTAVAVYRAYTSLFDWEAQFENSSLDDSVEDFDTSTDLLSDGTVMMVPCYGDGEDAASVEIQGWATGPNNYIKIYTPTSWNEAGASQRHDGKWDTTSAYRLSNTASEDYVIHIRGPYVRIDGIQVDVKENPGTKVNAIDNDEGGVAQEVHISNNIVRMSYATPLSDEASGIRTLNANATADNNLYVVKVWNNIVYGFRATNKTAGIYSNDYGTVYAYNNTVVGDGGAATESYAFLENSGVALFYAKNNVAIDADDPYSGVVTGAGSNNNLSDLADAPGANPQNGNEPIFVNKAGDDYHLSATDTFARNLGADLSADSNLAFTLDIDRETRFTPWDIGADEVRGAANYRSIGTRGGYGPGEADGIGTSVSAIDGSVVVSGAGTEWLTYNRGRGDRITIDGTDYTILSVDSEVQLTLTSPFSGTTSSGKSYTISRKFTTLQDWEDCISFDQPPLANVTLSDGWYTGTGPYTVPAGSDRLLVFVSGYEDPADPGITVSFGGQAMTEAITHGIGSSPYGRVSIFYLKDADIPSGSQSFTVTNGSPSRQAHAYALFTNVNQVVPVLDTEWGTSAVATVTTQAPFNVAEGGMSVSNVMGGIAGDYVGWGGWQEATDQISGTATFGTGYTTSAYGADGTDTATATLDSSPPGHVIVAASFAPATLACEGVWSTDYASDNRNEIGIAYDDSVFTAGVVFDGSTTDPSYAITLTADTGNRHLGLPGNGVVLDNGANSTDAVLIQDDHVTVEWLEVTGGTGGANGINVESLNASNHIVLRNLLVHHTDSTGLQLNDADIVADVYNNISYASSSGRGIRGSVNLNAGALVRVFNNTVYENGYKGIEFTGSFSNVILRNNIAHSNDTQDFDVSPLDATSSHNLASDTFGVAHSPAGGGQDSVALSGLGGVNFVDDTLPDVDLHIQGGSAAVDVGVNLSTFFSNDIDDGPRPPGGLWDIGADEQDTTGSVLTLSDHSAGQTADKFESAASITDVLFRFRLIRAGTATVATVRVNFTTTTGVVDGDVTGGELWVDVNGDGAVDGGDIEIQTGVSASGGVLTFNTNFIPTIAGTDYLVRATVNNLSGNDRASFWLGVADIDEVEVGVTEWGAATPAFHSQGAAVNYRSIGTRADYGTSGPEGLGTTVTATAGSMRVIGAGTQWIASNRGRGDRITIDGTHYTILVVDSPNQITLTTPFEGATGSGLSYTISRKFNTLQAWENCLSYFTTPCEGVASASLVADGRFEVGIAYKDSVFTAGVTIDGATTDTTHNITLTVDPGNRHSGVAGGGVILDGQDTDQGIRIQDDYTVLEWFELKRIRGGASAAAVVVQEANNLLVQNLLIHDFDDASNFVDGIRAQNNVGYTVRNCIIYDGDSAGIRNNEATATGTVQNCTLYSNQRGVLVGAGTMTVTNTIAVGNPTADFEGSMTGSHNMSTDLTAFNLFGNDPNAITGATSANEFIDDTIATADLHLSTGALAIDDGQDLSGQFTTDIDGATRIGSWDMGADEGGVAGCCDLQVMEGAGTVTVTAPGSFELRFNEATGGGIDRFFDLAEDPGRTVDLAGGTSEVKTLFHVNLFDGATFFTTSTNDDGAQADLLEVTATRVRVRQNTFLQDQGGPTILGGAKGFGDYSIYPSGKMALKWNLTTTTAVAYQSQGMELGVHYSSTGGNPLNNWTAHRELGTTFGVPPNSFGDDDFVMMRNDSVGARTDFLQILYRDWAAPPYVEDADYSDSVQNGAFDYAFVNWRATGAAGLPADSNQIWNFLSFFKPTNFVDNTDPAVTGRVDDYRPRTACATCGPDDLATPVAPIAGDGWFHTSENTAGPSDFFNEDEGVYTLDFDMSSGLTFDIDGGLGTPGTPVRYSPFFKVRQWRSLQAPDAVTLEGTALANGTDFTADVKPLSRVYAAQDPIWYSTLQETSAISPPDIGSVGIIMGTPSYAAARYGQGARFDGSSDVIRFGSTGMDVTKGTVEFWIQPEFDHTDGVRHTFWFNLGSLGDFFQLEKTAADALEFSINNGTLTSVSISSANYSWSNKDWVHILATWNEAASPGSQLQLYVNGSEPTHTDSGTYTSTDLTVGNNYIGNHSGGSFPAIAIIDEFVLYEGNHQPSMRAYAGLTTHPDEYMASSANNLVLALWPADADGRTDYFYFGSDSQFRGLNILLETAGIGTPLLKWEYWDGVNSVWADLDTLGTFVDETNSLTERSGAVYWEEDPPGWQPYSVAGGPDLYYVRLHALLGSNYTTLPKESLIKTDILLFQYCGDLTAAAQTFNFPVPPPTAVDLVSFEARGLDEAVELTWQTGSEIDNLGFNLYRSSSPNGLFEKMTPTLIPGLGSSPVGAKYSYTDSGLTNGVTYYYKLEDIETMGKTEMHGPVWATSHVAEDPGAEESPNEEETETPAHDNHAVGQPELNRLNILSERTDELVLELLTEGFYAIPQEDGTVRLEIPDFGLTDEEGHPALPVKRTWVQALADRKVEIASVEVSEEEVFEDLRPEAAVMPVLEASARGTVELRRGSRRQAAASEEKLGQPMAGAFYPEQWARVLETAYQQEVKKALVELAPLRWDETGERLVLAHRLVVRVVFRGQDEAETRSRRRARGERGRANRVQQNMVARLVAGETGLYGVSFDQVIRRRRAAAVRADSLRLSRQGETVPFYLQPNPDVFGPGTKLYFVSEGAEANRYGREAVYELEVGVEGERMESGEASPGGEPIPYYWEVVSREENHLYQAALVKAPDRWLWSSLFAPVTKSYPYEVSGLSPKAETVKVSVWLQGTTDYPEDPDHHVRLLVKGQVVGEASWNGKAPKRVDGEFGANLLEEGENLLELENVGDTGARYSMVMLNRFEVSYPRKLEAVEGRLAGDWSLSGTAEVSGLSPQTIVLEKRSDKNYIWLTGAEATESGIKFRAEGDRSYLTVSSEAVQPVVEVRWPLKSALKLTDHRADYLMIGPREFIEAAGLLVEHRESQGLEVIAVSVEEVFSEFGFGEENPVAIRDFLSYAYHQWEKAPRYVLLLGDATFDFKDYLGSGVLNRVPPLMVLTNYLETASDPAYAAVNGEDLLPDLAIGRLPASTVEELGVMVSKIVSWETSGGSLGGRAVLVADNPDGAGDFTADAEELAETTLSSHDLEKIYLSELGTASTRSKILQAFDEGSSLMSYIGHGGIDLWASEDIFNTDDVQLLSLQTEQPLLLTMNCLNGYFHFPFINALAEEVLKAEGKGIVAAISPSGLSVNSAAHVFHRLLLEELVNGGHIRLGDAVLAAQSAYVDSGALPEMIAIYHLFGDPALRLIE